jgi:hypothetical protein
MDKNNDLPTTAISNWAKVIKQNYKHKTKVCAKQKS